MVDSGIRLNGVQNAELKEVEDGEQLVDGIDLVLLSLHNVIGIGHLRFEMVLCDLDFERSLQNLS